MAVIKSAVLVFLIRLSVQVFGSTGVSMSSSCALFQAEPPYECIYFNQSSGPFEGGEFKSTFNAKGNLEANFDAYITVHVKYETKNIPAGLAEKFSNVRALHAEFCKIQSISREDFTNLTKLIILDIRINMIEVLTEDVFAELEHLQALDITGNPIKVLPPNVFEACKSLKICMAHDNKIVELPEKLFANNPNMTLIDFSKGALKSIKVDFTKLQNLHVVDLLNNTCVSAEFDKNATVLQDLQDILKEKC